MYIGCTKKLSDYLQFPLSDETEAPLFSWSANLLIINRRKVIAVVNDACRYGFVLYGITAKALKNLDNLLLEGVRACLEEACVDPELIDRYLADCKTPVYRKTASRKAVARMNKFCDRVKYLSDEISPSSIHQSSMVHDVNNDIFEINGAIHTPSELLYHELGANYSVENVRKCSAGVFDIRLGLESVCTRRVIVPMNYTFALFHRVLQMLFNWQDCHLHQFILQVDAVGRIKTAVLSEYCIKEGENGDATVYNEIDIRLREVFPEREEIIYNYDFGDDWTHYIKLVEIKDYDREYPVCLSAEGDAPPEDVGGVYGYADFIKIINDPDNPDYQNMKDWAAYVGYKPPDIEMINRKFKCSL